MRVGSLLLVICLALVACDESRDDASTPVSSTFVTFWQGGELVSSDGRLRVVLAPNALSQSMELRIRKLSLEELGPARALNDLRFPYVVEPEGVELGEGAVAIYSANPAEMNPRQAWAVVQEVGETLEFAGAVQPREISLGALELSVPLTRLGRLAVHPAYTLERAELECSFDCYLDRVHSGEVSVTVNAALGEALSEASASRLWTPDLRVTGNEIVSLAAEPGDVRSSSLTASVDLTTTALWSFSYACDAESLTTSIGLEIASAGVIESAVVPLFELQLTCSGKPCLGLGAACSSNGPCCSTFCSNDACAAPPSCDPERDDTVGATPETAAQLLDFADGETELYGCTGEVFRDVFYVELEAGKPFGLVLDITNANAFLGTSRGVNNLELSLFRGGPVKAVNLVGQSYTHDAQERIDITPIEGGSHYFVVESFDGSEAPYTLSFAEGVACRYDTDCLDPGHTCQLTLEIFDGSTPQTCQDYTAPSCGQSTDEGFAHSDSNAPNLLELAASSSTGTVHGSICSRDTDVYAIPLEPYDTVSITLKGTLDSDTTVYGQLVDDMGTPTVRKDLVGYIGGDDVQVFVIGPVPEAGTWYLVLNHYNFVTVERSNIPYTLDVEHLPGADACLTDADCDTGERCGAHLTDLPRHRPYCVTSPDNPCGETADLPDARSAAAPVSSGEVVASQSCYLDSDYLALTLTEAQNDVDIRLTHPDRDHVFGLELYADDGTEIASTWGSSDVSVTASALPPGTLVAHVTYLYTASYDIPLEPGKPFDYELVMTTTPSAAPCVTHADCSVYAGEPDYENYSFMACDATSGTCQRRSPFPSEPFSRGVAEGCESDAECATAQCLSGICTVACEERSNDLCDEAFGPDRAVCEFFNFYDVWCVPKCDATGDAFLFSELACQETFDEQASCDALLNTCRR